MTKIAHEGCGAITNVEGWPGMQIQNTGMCETFPPRTVEDEHGGEWLGSVDVLIKNGQHVMRFLDLIDRPDEAEIVRMLVDCARAAKLEGRWLPSRGFSKCSDTDASRK